MKQLNYCGFLDTHVNVIYEPTLWCALTILTLLAA